MNKKVLGLAVLVIALATGLLFLKPNAQVPQVENLSQSTMTLKQEPQETLPAHVKTSLFNSLTPNVIFAFTVFPEKYSFVADHFANLKTKLSQTKLWKQNNGDALLENVENEVKVSASGNAPKDLPSFDFVKFLTENWRSVSEITFAFLDDSKDIGQGLTIPKTLVEVTSKSAPLLSEFKNFLKKNTPHTFSKDDITTSLEQSPNNENQYLLTISSDDSKVSIKGSLIFEETKASLLVNADSLSDFIAKDPGKTLLNSPQWNSASHHYYDETFSLYAFQYEKFVSLFQKILSLISPASDTNGSNLRTDLYKGMYELFGGINYKGGLNISQCLNLDPASFIGKQYALFFNKTKNISNENIFARLLSKNTVLGLSLSAAQLNLFSMMALGNFSEDAITEAEKEPEIKKIIAALSKRKNLLTNFPFDHVYFLLNTPQGGGFIPDSYIMLHGSQKDAPMFLSEVKSLIEEINPDFHQLTLTKDPNGKDILKIQIDPKFHILAKYLPDGSIVITHTETIVDSIQKKLSATKNFSDLITISGKPAKEEFGKSELSYYIANKPIFDFGKPFLGLLTMSAPEIKITPTDVDEVLRSLEFALASTSESTQPSSSTICSASHSVIADIQQQDETL